VLNVHCRAIIGWGGGGEFYTEGGIPLLVSFGVRSLGGGGVQFYTEGGILLLVSS
jgi:hypothetical protein